jgi:hypothetical protein
MAADLNVKEKTRERILDLSVYILVFGSCFYLFNKKNLNCEEKKLYVTK